MLEAPPPSFLIACLAHPETDHVLLVSIILLVIALYEVWAAHDDAFYDVTTGTNEQRCPGWPATTGYDTVTGVGTPNYAALSKYILDL